jgi:hypothetical protein
LQQTLANIFSLPLEVCPLKVEPHLQGKTDDGEREGLHKVPCDNDRAATENPEKRDHARLPPHPGSPVPEVSSACVVAKKIAGAGKRKTKKRTARHIPPRRMVRAKY